MPHSDETFYKMRCGWAGDPKVATLERFGAADAIMARDLFSQMIDYARRELTDGLVPRAIVPSLMWPLPAEDALRLLAHLADPGQFGPLVSADTNGNTAGITSANTPGSAFRVLAYGKWNDTRADVQARKERGSKAIRSRWDRRDSEGITTSNTAGNTQAIHRGRAQVDTEQEQEQEKPSPVQHRSTVPARGGESDDDVREDRTDLAHAVVALMHTSGHTITAEQALKLIDLTLAGHRPRDPRAYVVAAIKRDPAKAHRLIAVSHQPPPPSPELFGARPGGPASTEQVHARAADARAMMAAKRAPAEPEGGADDEPDW